MDPQLFFFVLVGFFAQMIDGALGMGYGVCSTSLLLSMGIAPAPASASVHTAEVVTTAVSGWSHFRLGNVHQALFKRLVIPGVVGGMVGAYLLSRVPGDTIKPWVSLYLLLMGIVVLRKVWKKVEHKPVEKRLRRLGLFGGFMDAVGGGGWGPIVTSTLVANGNHPRFTIGSVNLAEFFVAVSQAGVFFVTLGLVHKNIILGLIIGGALAAPLAAYACRRIQPRTLMLLVGCLIVVLSLRTLVLALT